MDRSSAGINKVNMYKDVFWDIVQEIRNVEIWHSNTSCVNESKTKNNATNDFVPVTGYEERRERKGVLKGTGGG